jgi:hypothetical protein
MNPRLPFDDAQPTHTVTTQVRCSGCPATARITKTYTRRSRWPDLPIGWAWCGETPNGEPKLWCAQCFYERRHEQR